METEVENEEAFAHEGNLSQANDIQPTPPILPKTEPLTTDVALLSPQALDNNFSCLNKSAESFVQSELGSNLQNAVEEIKSEIKNTAIDAANVSHEKLKLNVESDKIDNETRRLENEDKKLDNATFNLKLKLKKKAMRREERFLKQEQRVKYWARHKEINDIKFAKLRLAGIGTNNLLLLKIISLFFLLDDIKKGTNKLLKTTLTFVFWSGLIALVIFLFNTPIAKSLLQIFIK